MVQEGIKKWEPKAGLFLALIPGALKVSEETISVLQCVRAAAANTDDPHFRSHQNPLQQLQP